MRVKKGLVIAKYLNNLANKVDQRTEYYKIFAYTKAAEAFKELSNSECDLVLGDDLEVEAPLKVKFVGPKIRAKVFKTMLDDKEVLKLENEVLSDLQKQSGNPHKHYMTRSEATLKISSLIQELDEMNIYHEVAGSFRRGKDLVGDIDIIIKGKMPDKSFFSKYGQVTAYGGMKVKLVMQGLEVDFRSSTEESFPFMLAHFTGSAAHNQWLRSIAKARGFKLNEYGLFDLKTGQRALGYFKEESDIYDFLGVKYVVPQDR